MASDLLNPSATSRFLSPTDHRTAAEQTLLTTAGVLPEIVRPARVVRVSGGRVEVKDTGG